MTVRKVLAVAGAGIFAAGIWYWLRRVNPSTEYLVSELREGGPCARVWAAGRVAGLYGKGGPMVGALVPLLGDGRMCEGVAERLWNTFSLLGGAGQGVDNAAVKALTAVGDASIEPVIEALRSEDARTRWNAALALGGLAERNIRQERMTGPLVERLGDGDRTVRLFAARALGALGDKRAIEPLAALAESGDAEVRDEVKRALGRMGVVRPE